MRTLTWYEPDFNCWAAAYFTSGKFFKQVSKTCWGKREADAKQSLLEQCGDTK